jgi:hypothetical protein
LDIESVVAQSFDRVGWMPFLLYLDSLVFSLSSGRVAVREARRNETTSEKKRE